MAEHLFGHIEAVEDGGIANYTRRVLAERRKAADAAHGGIR